MVFYELNGVRYHSMYRCPMCNSAQKIIETDACDNIVCEAKTICNKCGHADLWAYGFYESSKDIYYEGSVSDGN